MAIETKYLRYGISTLIFTYQNDHTHLLVTEYDHFELNNIKENQIEL